MTIAEQVGQRLTERGEWQAGMLLRDTPHGGYMMIGGVADNGDLFSPSFDRWFPPHACIPDLTDWPTLGVLIGAILRADQKLVITSDIGGVVATGLLEHCGTGGRFWQAIAALYLATCPAPEATP